MISQIQQMANLVESNNNKKKKIFFIIVTFFSGIKIIWRMVNNLSPNRTQVNNQD